MIDQQEGQKVKEEVQQEIPNPGAFLKNFQESPSPEQIETWKQTHGEVLCSGFSEEEIYVWRPLTRMELVTLQQEARAASAQQGQPVSDLVIEDQIVHTCKLWASPAGVKALQTKAGSISALHEQIMLHSNFLNPAMAAALVVKL